MSDKPIRFSREAADALVPRVQGDHSDFAARGALADALEESGIHHDDETLSHLRAFDKPVYGMKHPDSGKYVFSPRRRWLLGELLKHFDKNPEYNSGIFIKPEKFNLISGMLGSIGLKGHSDFFKNPSMVDSTGEKIDKSFIIEGTDWGAYIDHAKPFPDYDSTTTITPQGYSMSLSHPFNSTPFDDEGQLQNDFENHRRMIDQEHQEMNKEDELYSDTDN